MTSICTNKAKPIPAPCRPCSLDQARSASRFAGLSEKQSLKIIELARQTLSESEKSPMLVQHIVRRVADAIIREKGESPDFDIYAAVKEESNRLAAEASPELFKVISESPDPLVAAMQIAGSANIIDFGAEARGNLDIEKELLSLREVGFARCDVDTFRKRLEGASNLLYLCDNCGEIVLDKLFIHELQQAYPDLKITAAVRERPIINDATMDDARAVGLDVLVPVVSSGSVYPGTVLPECSESFMELYNSADLILSKGQGNFETLLPEGDERIFFLLRIKCDYMAKLADVEKGRLILMQGA